MEFKPWTVGFRIGEALHPGPYSEGGASGSGLPREAQLCRRDGNERAEGEGGGHKRARRWEHTAQRGDRWLPAEVGEKATTTLGSDVAQTEVTVGFARGVPAMDSGEVTGCNT